MLISAQRYAFAATSPWTQTNWAGGSGQAAFTDSTKYSSSSLVTASTANQVTLSQNFGTGADGAVTVSSDKNLNVDNMISGRSCADGGDAVNYSVTSSVSAGAGSITLSSTPAAGCLAANDEILIINLQGTSGDNSNVGKFETATIASVASATLTLNGTLTNAYDGTTQKIMVQRVPNYTNVTINSTKTLSASAWNGTKGGVIFFRASGTVTVTGAISSNALGFRGGTGAVPSGSNVSAQQGEGYVAGQSNSGSTNNGGGGGGNSNQSGVNDTSGGGGGGYGTAGSTGSAVGSGTINPFGGGVGGGTYGTAALSKLYLGGGGGAGGGSDAGCSSSAAGGSGGKGAGIVYVAAQTVSITGGVTATGANGTQPGTTSCTGGAGGGAGGSINIVGSSLTLGSSLVSAAGGAGGGSAGFAGGGGAAGTGRIAVFSPNSISGTTNPTYGTSSSAYASSGTLTSSIFDSGSSTAWGTLTLASTTPTNTTATVKVRSGNQSDLSDATSFSSCTAITSGAAASANSCAPTGRYAQYLLTLATTDTSVTPTFTSFSLAFAGVSSSGSSGSSSSSSSGSSNSSPSAPSCGDTAPAGIPDLFQIDPGKDSVMLHFTTTSGTSGYQILYGQDSSANQYSDTFDYSGPLWILDRQIHGLAANTTYYFKVKSANGCSAGGESKTVQVKTTGAPSSTSASSQTTTTQKQASTSPAKKVAEIPVLNTIVDKKIEVQKAELFPTPSPKVVAEVPKAQVEAKTEAGEPWWSGLSKIKLPEIQLPNVSEMLASAKINVDWSQLQPKQAEPVAVPEKLAEAKDGYDLDIKVLADAGTPLKDVTVTLHSKPMTSKTNDEGIASFKNVEPGPHKVYLAFNGYSNGGQAINVTGDNKDLELVMQIKLTEGFSSPKIIAVLVILLLIIAGLVWYIITNKKQKKDQTK